MNQLTHSGHVLQLSEGDDAGGHWVTIAGAHVFIGKDGTIEQGPAELKGKTIEEASKEGKHVTEVHGSKKPVTDPSSPSELSSQIEEDHPGLKLEIQNKKSSDGPVWELAKIVVPEDSRGMGIGSSVMKRITEAADKAGATLSLSPSTDFGASSVSRLKSFYAGFGFVANKGRAADLSIGGSMIRTPKKSEIAFSRATVIASPDAEFKPALTLGQGLPPEVMGQPAAYFWKEALVPGNYQDRAGTKFTIDAKRVDNLIANFNKAKANGFTPRVPDGHTSSAKTNMGFILEARKNSRGGLELLHQMVGDDAIKAVARNKTSICTVANAIDEHGNEYDELIDHNAIVPDPQLNNLRDFVPALAASRAATESAIVLTPAADTERSPEMDLIKLREAIGAAKEVTDEQVISQAVAKLGESTTQLQLSRSAVDTTKTDLTTAITRAEQAEAKVLELSRMNSAPDLDVLNDRAALKSERIDLALERGQCTKAQADLLKASLKDGDKPAVLMLSKSGTHGTPVDLMLKVLELNKPFVGLSLSRAQQLPDPNNPSPAMTEARKKELLAHAGV